MYNAIIRQTEKVNSQTDRELYLDVTVEFLETKKNAAGEDEVVDSEIRRYGMPLNISKEDLLADVKKALDLWKSEKLQKIEQSKVDAKIEAADKVAEEVQGTVIS